jgi:16S rRNA (guanine527-N7)-methyltransferase
MPAATSWCIRPVDRIFAVHVSRETPGAVQYFGDDLTVIDRYVQILATRGIERGIIGPREAPRLWERHIQNCAVVVPRIPESASVADVGSGGGLPGLVWAIARPDVRVTLIEPLLRRTTFLSETVDELALTNVTVLRARADEVSASFDVVTARAVADLGKLAAWCLPLVRPGGVMLALKGQSASAEVEQWKEVLHGLGSTDIVVASYGEEPLRTTVVEVTR